MKTIIVATDFSAAALNAARYAADMAVVIDAQLLLFHVHDMPFTYLEIYASSNFDLLEQEASSEMQKLKDELNILTENKINITTELTWGLFFEELQLRCRNFHPYAVVMGCQGTSGMEHFLYGRHTINAMKHLKFSLITVPLGSKYGTIKKVGLACDLQNVSATVPVDEIKTLLSSFNAELHVINTDKTGRFDPNVIPESGTLEKLLLPFHSKFHFISSGEIDESIIDFIDKNSIDLLIVLPKHHNLLERIVFKSQSKQLIIHSHVPVMALHHA